MLRLLSVNTVCVCVCVCVCVYVGGLLTHIIHARTEKSWGQHCKSLVVIQCKDCITQILYRILFARSWHALPVFPVYGRACPPEDAFSKHSTDYPHIVCSKAKRHQSCWSFPHLPGIFRDERGIMSNTTAPDKCDCNRTGRSMVWRCVHFHV